MTPRRQYSNGDLKRLFTTELADGAYDTLVACDGQPPAALVHRLFGDAPEGPSARDEL